MQAGIVLGKFNLYLVFFFLIVSLHNIAQILETTLVSELRFILRNRQAKLLHQPLVPFPTFRLAIVRLGLLLLALYDLTDISAIPQLRANFRKLERFFSNFLSFSPPLLLRHFLRLHLLMCVVTRKPSRDALWSCLHRTSVLLQIRALVHIAIEFIQ